MQAKRSMAEYLAVRERALDWLAFMRRLAATLEGRRDVPQLLTPSLVRDALGLARRGEISTRLAPRDKSPLVLP